MTDLLTKADEPVALAPADPPPSGDLAVVIERLAANPGVDVAKLEKIIDLQERILRHQAKVAFDEAFTRLAGDLPVIAERAKTNNGRYAPLEDIIEAVRPILTQHGFALSHRTEWLDKGTVKVIGILTHQMGHEKTSEFLSGADSSGNKNAIQGLGSAVTYGRRYTTNDLLCIVTRHEDDDGRKAGRVPPEGYAEWLLTLADKSTEGLPALQAMWKTANEDKSLKPFAEYLTKTEPDVWQQLKDRAKGAK